MVVLIYHRYFLRLICHCFLRAKAYVTWPLSYAKLTTNYWDNKILIHTQEEVFERFVVNVSENSEDFKNI